MVPPVYTPDGFTDSMTEDKRLASYIGGVACRLPKSANVEIFWKNLIGKVDMIDENRWPIGMYKLPPRTGTLTNVEEFDNCFFDISADEVSLMPCMLRQLLEVIYKCITDSGIPQQTLSKSRTGLYLAINFCEDQEINREVDSIYVNTKSEFIYRIFSILDLSGPAVCVDTACSSSLSALQMANMDLCYGRCDYAIVAGANLLENLTHSIQFNKLKMLSPNGVSSPFDTKANGYVRSEGFVAMLLSSSHLLHRIYAKINHVMCLSEGYKEQGMLSPSEKDQMDLLKDVYRDRCPVYVEAHATGTKLGDEAELTALKNTFGNKLKGPLLLGSCKSNLGHTEACAGLVSLLKCVLSIHHGVIPPNINFTSPHPLLAGSNPWAKVVEQETKLPDGYIGVSSFGFGGVIGHVILEQLPKKTISIPKYALLPLKLQDGYQSKKIISHVHDNISRMDILNLMSTASFCLTPEPDFIGYIKIFQDDMVVDVKNLISRKPIWIVLNDILFTDQSIIDKDIFQIEFIFCSLKKYQSILSSKGSDFLQSIFFMEESKRRFKERFFLSAVTLIAYLDLLTECNFKPDRILGVGLSDIIVAYYDGCISLEACLSILDRIATYLDSENAIQTETPDQKSFVIRQLDIQKHYPRSIPVAIVNELTSYINVPLDDEETLKAINASGSQHKEISPPIQAYWQSEIGETLSHQLKSILRPKERSERWISCLSKRSTALKDRHQFGFNYVNNLLTHPIDLSGVKAPLDGSIFFLNGDKRLKHMIQLSETMDINYCHSNCSSILSTLGNLYLLNDNINISKVNPDVFPLDHRTPPIGHLISWDHKMYAVPEWQEYCTPIKNQLVSEYQLNPHEYMYELMPTLIANIIELSQEPQHAIAVDITYVVDFNQETFNGIFIEMLKGTHKIAAYSNDEELFIGSYKYMENLPENYILDDITEKSPSTAIHLERILIDVINSTYCFGCNKFNSLPYAFLYDENYHHNSRFAESGYNMNIEYETGICQAGGLVFRFLPKQIYEAPSEDNAIDILVTSVLFYDIAHQTEAYVIIYTGCNESETQHYIGVCLLADGYEFVQKQIKVPEELQLGDLSKVLPYMISHHLLNEVLTLKNKTQTLVIHPQYDSLAMFLAMVAKDLCQHVYLCCWGEEITNDLQVLMPEVTVLSAQNTNDVLSLSKGRGFNAAIKFSGADLNKSLLSLANYGRMALCGKPNLLEDLKLGVFLKNITFKVTEPLNAVTSFLSSDESWNENFLALISSERFIDLWESDVLKEPSSVYGVLENSELNKIRLSTLIPRLKLKTVSLPSLPPISPKDERFIKSLTDTLSDIVEKLFPMQHIDVPEPLQQTIEQKPIPVVTINSSPVIMAVDSSLSKISPVAAAVQSPKQLAKRKSPHSLVLNASLLQIRTDYESLFVLSPPRTAYSPKIEEYMKIEEVIVSLNSVQTKESPLIIVHPITGVISLLRNLGSMLSVPCYGIQMTELTPRKSISDMASFYVKALLEKFPEGPYRLAGYSFGACVAVEMALQMQSYLKIELLLMLDGSPEYIRSHIGFIKEELSTVTAKISKEELQEIGYMVSFIGMYKPMEKELQTLVYSSLLQLNRKEERIEFLLNFLHGKALQSPTPAKINWLTTSHKMWYMNRPDSDFVSTTTEVLRASKTKKCLNFIENSKIGEKYISEKKFNGPIHLFRIKHEPERCLPLPSDYGISKICSDVLVRFYDGEHTTFLNKTSVCKDIEKLIQSLKDTGRENSLLI